MTGATGFLGFRTLEKLVEEDWVNSVIATGRTLRTSHTVDHLKVNYQLGDLCDVKFVQSLVQQADMIIHAAALSSPWGKEAEFKKANIDPQAILIEAAIKFGIKRFIYVSTPSMYFSGKNRFNIKESDLLPNQFVNQYSETKREAEILLEDSGLEYVILRPRALTGRGDTVIMPRLIRAYDEGRLKIIGNGKNMADLTSVANVADALILSIQAEREAVNQTYNITNDEPVELWKSIEMVLNLMGKKLNKKKVPFGLVIFIAQLMEWKSKLSNYKEPALTKYGVGVLAKSQTLNVSKAKNLLGYTPKITNDEAIIEFVEWYKTYEKN